MSQTRDRLSKLVGERKSAHLTRGYPGEPSHIGFVLGQGVISFSSTSSTTSTQRATRLCESPTSSGSARAITNGSGR